MRLAKLVTLAQAADLMGETGSRQARARRVRRILLAHANATDILVRLPGKGLRPRLMVSVAALREYVPGLRDRESEVAAVVRSELASLDQALVDMRKQAEAFDRVMGSRVRYLEKQVERIVARLRGPDRAG